MRKTRYIAQWVLHDICLPPHTPLISDLCIPGVASQAPWSHYCPWPSYCSVESGSLPTSWWFFFWGPSYCSWVSVGSLQHPPNHAFIYGRLYMYEPQIWLEFKLFSMGYKTLLFMSPSILWQLSWNKGTYKMVLLNSTDHDVCVWAHVCVCI